MSNAPDEDGPDYDLVCPSCGSRCVGKTYARGVHGTYRNPYVNYYVRRVVCTHCGLVNELTNGASLEHRFWYRIKIGDNVLWAVNELRLRNIREVLVGHVDRNDAFLYTLPKWLVRKRNREKAVAQIDEMLADPSVRRIVDA